MVGDEAERGPIVSSFTHIYCMPTAYPALCQATEIPPGMRHRPCPPGAHNLVGETGSKRSSNHNTLSDKRYEENRTFFFFLRRGI